ncbi:MAG: hypothetical protein ABIH39_03055 [Candidatus Margulisiibacteriota bacterium]
MFKKVIFYLKEQVGQILDHHRDFLPGISVLQEIGAEIPVIISRNRLSHTDMATGISKYLNEKGIDCGVYELRETTSGQLEIQFITRSSDITGLTSDVNRWSPADQSVKDLRKSGTEITIDCLELIQDLSKIKQEAEKVIKRLIEIKQYTNPALSVAIEMLEYMAGGRTNQFGIREGGLRKEDIRGIYDIRKNIEKEESLGQVSLENCKHLSLQSKTWFITRFIENALDHVYHGFYHACMGEIMHGLGEASTKIEQNAGKTKKYYGQEKIEREVADDTMALTYRSSQIDSSGAHGIMISWDFLVKNGIEKLLKGQNVAEEVRKIKDEKLPHEDRQLLQAISEKIINALRESRANEPVNKIKRQSNSYLLAHGFTDKNAIKRELEQMMKDEEGVTMLEYYYFKRILKQLNISFSQLSDEQAEALIACFREDKVQLLNLAQEEFGDNLGIDHDYTFPREDYRGLFKRTVLYLKEYQISAIRLSLSMDHGYVNAKLGIQSGSVGEMDNTHNLPGEY